MQTSVKTKVQKTHSSEVRFSKVTLEGFLTLIGVWTLAITRPLLSTLGEAGSFFVAHEVNRVELITFTLAVALFFPMLLCGLLYLISRKFERYALILWGVLVTLLAAVLFFSVSNHLNFSPYLIILLSLVFGALVCLFAVKLDIVRSGFAIASIAALLLPFWFLAFTPVKALLSDSKEFAGATSDINNKVPVVVMLFDEFNPTALLDSDGKIDTVRFPNFSRLASTSTRYPRTSSVHYRTTTAVPAILTGVRPEVGDNRLPSLSNHSDNLFTLFGPSYDMNVIETFTNLCPDTYCATDTKESGLQINDFLSDIKIVLKHIYYPKAFAATLPSLTEGWRGFGQNNTDNDSSALSEKEKTRLKLRAVHGVNRTDIYNKFLDGLNAENNTLDFIHVLLPHTGWRYLPNGQTYQSRSMGRQWQTQGEADEVYQRYLLQLGFVDTLLGITIDRLEALGKFDETLLFVVADHGLNFQPKQDIRDIGANPSVLHIPLIVKYPGQKVGNIDDRLSLNIDIIPTISSVLEVDLPWVADGLALNEDVTRSELSLEIKQGKTVFYPKANDIFTPNILDDRVAKFSEKQPLTDLMLTAAYPSLIGKDVSSLAIVNDDTVEVEINLKGDVEVDTESNYRPSLVYGKINKMISPRDVVAVALNGRVVAIARVSERNDNHTFSAVLPASAWINGSNQINAYLVSDLNKPLRALSVTQNPFELLEKDGQTTLRKISSDTEYKVIKQVNFGDYYIVDADDQVYFTGWAANTNELKPAVQVIAFLDKSVVGIDYSPNRPTPLLSKTYKSDKLKKAKFHIAVPASVIKSNKLKIFAIFEDGTAALLKDTTPAK